MRGSMKNKQLTLEQFKKKHGATKAAALIGVTTVTVWRWQTRRTKPEGNDARRLLELGVTVA